MGTSAAPNMLTVICVTILCGLVSAQIPEVPDLPTEQRYQINVEATIYRNNLTSNDSRRYTASFEEFVDLPGMRGLAIETIGSKETRFYYDTQYQQGFNVTRDKSTTPLYQSSCETTNITASTKMFGGFGIRSQNGKLVIANVSQFFQWSKSSSPEFQAYETIRGINASKWFLPVSTTTGPQLVQYNLTFWFSYNHVMPYYTADKPVPLRIEMSGSSNVPSGNAVFHHIYDITLFAPLGDRGDSFYAMPKGIFCPNRIVPQRSELTFPNQYSIREEIINYKKKSVTQSVVYFDYDLKMTRGDYEWEDDAAVTGASNIRVIHDFHQNYQVIIFPNNNTCKITSIPATPGYLTWDVKEGSTANNIQMAHTRDIMQYGKVSYQGKRVERGLDIDVWAHRETYLNGTVAVTEYWYTTNNWKVRSTQSLSASYKVLVGYYSISYNKNSHSQINEIQGNIYDQYYGPLQANVNSTNDIFDVLTCYNKSPLDLEHISFNLGDTSQLWLNNQITRNSLTRAIRGHFAALARVSPTRITNIEIYEITPNSGIVLKVYFTLRSKLLLSAESLAGRVSNEVDNSNAVTLMETQLASPDGIQIQVQAKDGSKSIMIVESLLSNDNGDLAEQIAGKDPSDTKAMPSYGPAAMAGLGIGMLLLGAILTIAVGGILWIKRFDINIPYLTQNNE